MRISVDLPAPFGPSSPNIPGGIVNDTLFSARVPFSYVLDNPSMRRSMPIASPDSLKCEQRERCVGNGRDVGERLAIQVQGYLRHPVLDQIAATEDDLPLERVAESRFARAVAIPRIIARDELPTLRRTDRGQAVPPEAPQEAVARRHRLGAERDQRIAILAFAGDALLALVGRPWLVSAGAAELQTGEQRNVVGQPPEKRLLLIGVDVALI